jgi:hypothetical protein
LKEVGSIAKQITSSKMLLSRTALKLFILPNISPDKKVSAEGGDIEVMVKGEVGKAFDILSGASGSQKRSRLEKG